MNLTTNSTSCDSYAANLGQNSTAWFCLNKNVTLYNNGKGSKIMLLVYLQSVSAFSFALSRLLVGYRSYTILKRKYQITDQRVQFKQSKRRKIRKNKSLKLLSIAVRQLVQTILADIKIHDIRCYFKNRPCVWFDGWLPDHPLIKQHSMGHHRQHVGNMHFVLYYLPFKAVKLHKYKDQIKDLDSVN